MTIIERVRADRHAAMKARDQEKVNTLTTLLGDLETNERRAGNSVDEVSILKKYIENASQMLMHYHTLGDSVNLVRLNTQLKVYNTYMPRVATVKDMDDFVESYIDAGVELNVKGFMQAVNSAFEPGTVDKKVIREMFQGRIT